MYLDHFGMRELPFTLAPNRKFFFNDGEHREALNVLMVALRSGEGFIKITGEVGTGKTLLCAKLMSLLGPDYVTAYISNPLTTPTGLLCALEEELGCAPTNAEGNNVLGHIASSLFLSRLGGGGEAPPRRDGRTHPFVADGQMRAPAVGVANAADGDVAVVANPDAILVDARQNLDNAAGPAQRAHRQLQRSELATVAVSDYRRIG